MLCCVWDAQLKYRPMLSTSSSSTVAKCLENIFSMVRMVDLHVFREPRRTAFMKQHCLFILSNKNKKQVPTLFTLSTVKQHVLCFSKFLQHLVAKASVPTNQIKELLNFALRLANMIDASTVNSRKLHQNSTSEYYQLLKQQT